MADFRAASASHGQTSRQTLSRQGLVTFPLTLLTLGDLRLIGPGGDPLRSRRMVLALLARLTRAGSTGISRDQLGALLWEPSDIAQARHSLRQALSELRALLPAEALRLAGEQVSLAPGAVEVDLTRFETALAAREWSGAIALYRGPFLPSAEEIGGSDWRVWVESERAAAVRGLGLAVEGAIAAATARGLWDEAISAAETWIREAPGHDPAARALLRTLVRAGARERAALAHAALLARAAAAGVEPSAELVRLGREIEGSAAPEPPVRGLLSPDLVGRETTLDQLSGHWGAVRTGEGRVVLVEADAGLGKSRLIEEFIRIARAVTPMVVVAGARPHRGDVPASLGVIEALLDELAAAPALPAAHAEDLLALSVISSEVRRRFPALAGQPTPDLGLALRRVLVEIAVEAPVLLWVDDADAADPQSLDLLAALARRPVGRCLIALAVRPLGSAHGFPADLRVSEDTEVFRVSLRELTAHEANAFFASMGPMAPPVPSELAAAAVEGLGGNPGHLRALVGQLASEGVLHLDGRGVWTLAAPIPRPLRLPEGARESTLRALAALPDDARLLLETAAVLGASTARTDLARLSALTPESFESALTHLASRRLLRPEDPAGRRLGFASPAARAVILDALPPGRRGDLERRSRAPAMEHRRRRLVVAGAGLLALGLLAALVATRSATPRVPVSILIADVRSMAADPGLDRTIALVAGMELRESPAVRVVPRSQIREALARMGKAGADTLLNEELALEVAIREGIPVVLALDAVPSRSGYVLSAELRATATGEVTYSAVEQVDGDAEILEGTGRLLSQIRRRLGDRSGFVAGGSTLPRVSTTSLAALRAYAEGQEAWSTRAYGVAAERWLTAVTLDSGFALAWSALADEAYRTNRLEAGDSLLRQAEAHADRLTPREQLALRVTLARRFGTDSDAIAAIRRLAEEYPGRDAWYTLGTTLMRAGRCDEAHPAFDSAVALDARFVNAYINRATCYQFQQRFDQAVVAYQEAGRLDSTALLFTNLGEEYGIALQMIGEYGQARAHFERMSRWPHDPSRGRGYRQLAWMALREGRHAAATRAAREALGISELINQPIGRLRDGLILARTMAGAGDSVAARDAFRAAWNARPAGRIEASFLVSAAHLAWHLGLGGIAREAAIQAIGAARPGVEADADPLAAARALVALLDGAPGDALRATDTRWPPASGARWGFSAALRAEAFIRGGHPDSAAALYATLATQPWLGWELQTVSDRVELDLARQLDGLGRTAEARALIERLLERWRAADPGTPDLHEARRLRERLRREGS